MKIGNVWIVSDDILKDKTIIKAYRGEFLNSVFVKVF